MAANGAVAELDGPVAQNGTREPFDTLRSNEDERISDPGASEYAKGGLSATCRLNRSRSGCVRS